MGRTVAAFLFSSILLFGVGITVGRRSAAPAATVDNKADAKPGEAKPAEAKPGDAKPAEGEPKKEEKKDDDDAGKPKVKFARVVKSVVSPRLVCFGAARSRLGTETVLTARTAAVVSEVCCGVGDPVKQGQTILRLDARQLVAAREKAQGVLAEAEAELRKGSKGGLEIELQSLKIGVAQAEADAQQADKNLVRQEELAASGLVSDRQLQEARAAQKVAKLKLEGAALQLERSGSGIQAAEVARLQARVAQARADLELARLQESYAEVQSPCNGTLAELDVTPGTPVDTSTVLARVTSPGTAFAVLSVPAERARSILPGADVRLLSAGEELARATVDGVGAAAGADGTVKLRASVVDERMIKSLVPGTPLAAEVATGKLECLVVPKEAVVQDHERTVVVTLDDKDVAHKLPVKVLCRDGPVVGIESDKLAVDMRVVVEGAYNLPDGAEVDVDD